LRRSPRFRQSSATSRENSIVLIRNAHIINEGHEIQGDLLDRKSVV